MALSDDHVKWNDFSLFSKCNNQCNRYAIYNRTIIITERFGWTFRRKSEKCFSRNENLE